MEAPEISESTPLLHSPPLPCIRLVIDRLLAQSNTTPTADHILAQFPHRDFTPSYRTAFVLVTLLQIESDTRKQPARDDSLNLWETWDHHVDAESVVEHCASHALEAWSDFLQVQRNDADLDALLWTKFSLEVGGSTGVCLADLLCQNVGDGLLIHPLLISSVSRTWKYGRVIILRPDSSFPSRLLYRMKTLGTPRVLYLMNLLTLSVYLATLAQYVMHPKDEASVGRRSLGPQGVCIVVYSLAASLGEPATCFPFYLVSLCFAISRGPIPGEASYTLTLLAILLTTLQLHLPHPLSPIHLLPPQSILPLSTFLLDGFTTVSAPVVLFFAPLLAISSYLLSSALADVLSLKPAPMEARAMFLFFSGFVLLLAISSLAFAVLSSGRLSQGNSGPTDRWDRYSLRVGLESRRIFVRTVRKYTSPSYFPFPFNILPLVLVGIPQIIILLLQKSEWIARIHKLETVLWSVLVLPLACVLAGFWLWGYV